MNVSLRRTARLAETIPAPSPELHPSAHRGSALPVQRNVSTSSVLPHLSLDEGRLRFEPATGPRYAEVKPLGAGGMGEVALVEDRDIGRKVARKRLHRGSSAADVVRFVDEIRTVGRLDHPGIVPIHDVGLDEHGEFFFIMKYVEGETLESVIERIREGDAATLAHWDGTRRVQLLISLLRALDYAHQRGMIHRDIKPANVMIGRFGEVLLLDWGLARPLAKSAGRAPPSEAPSSRSGGAERATHTHAGTILGTPLYMSPEQAAGEKEHLDTTSDLYSTCVLFLEFLTGEHPHEHVTEINPMLERILGFEAPSAASLVGRGAITPELAHFLSRGLQRRPHARWSSADEMADELHAILDGRCRIQCPLTLTKRVLCGLEAVLDRRPQLVLASLAVGTLGLVALVGLALRALFAG
ncbi:MAG: serine/threonine protein kinase [Deltaproteobacteria bacterium]|nr:serine/threonine protein kinase [Deltaproteobacteria bacterium]